MGEKKYISVLGVIACLGVVMMHVNNFSFWRIADVTGFASIFIEGICYFAVPVFFMISGANLLDYRERYNTATFLKKRFFKTVVPFLVWSLLGALYVMYSTEESITPVKNLILGVVNNNYVQVYWFFIPLFMAYLTMPLLSAVEHKKEAFGYAIIVGLVLEYALPYYTMLTGEVLLVDYKVPMFGGYIIYLLIGYYIDHYEIPKFGRFIIYGLGLYSVWLLTVDTYFKSNAIGSLDGVHKGVLNLPVLLYASAIFLLCKRLSGTKVEGVLYKISKPIMGTTFGVYLMHRGLLELFAKTNMPGMETVPFRIFGAIILLVVTSIIVKIMQKIPIVKWIVP